MKTIVILLFVGLSGTGSLVDRSYLMDSVEQCEEMRPLFERVIPVMKERRLAVETKCVVFEINPLAAKD